MSERVCVCERASASHIYISIHFKEDIRILLDGSNSEVEKAPFIAKPVRLTPAWEANNLPNDELNFRGIVYTQFCVCEFFFFIFIDIKCFLDHHFGGSLQNQFHFIKTNFKSNFIVLSNEKQGMTMERATLEINPPRDRLNIIFFILLLHGIGTLMPWNMFINAISVSFY